MVVRAASAKAARAVERDLFARVEGKQVAQMAMAGVGLLVILQPLLQLAMFADLQRRQLRAGLFQPRERRRRSPIACSPRCIA